MESKMEKRENMGLSICILLHSLCFLDLRFSRQKAHRKSTKNNNIKHEKTNRMVKASFFLLFVFPSFYCAFAFFWIVLIFFFGISCLFLVFFSFFRLSLLILRISRSLVNLTLAAWMILDRRQIWYEEDQELSWFEENWQWGRLSSSDTVPDSVPECVASSHAAKFWTSYQWWNPFPISCELYCLTDGETRMHHGRLTAGTSLPMDFCMVNEAFINVCSHKKGAMTSEKIWKE